MDVEMWKAELKKLRQQGTDVDGAVGQKVGGQDAFFCYIRHAFTN